MAQQQYSRGLPIVDDDSDDRGGETSEEATKYQETMVSFCVILEAMISVRVTRVRMVRLHRRRQWESNVGIAPPASAFRHDGLEAVFGCGGATVIDINDATVRSLVLFVSATVLQSEQSQPTNGSRITFRTLLLRTRKCSPGKTC
jgi:hypothetical protein